MSHIQRGTSATVEASTAAFSPVIPNHRRRPESEEDLPSAALANTGSAGRDDFQRPKRRRTNNTMKGSETSNNSNETNHTASDLDAIARRKMAGALNGWSKGETVKGSAATNGHSPNQPQLSMYFGHDRAEVSRLLIQALGDLGHSSLATSLAEESGVELEKPAVAEFREAIMQGNWTLAESYLSNRPSSPVSNGDSPKEEKDVLEFLESTTPLQVLFWIRQQKFLELLEAQDFGRATMVLRREIIDLIRGDTEKIHVLTKYLFRSCDMKVRTDLAIV